MSSSRVFKQDPLFTPTPLVQHNIVIPAREISPPVEEPPPAPPQSVPEPQAPPQAEEVLPAPAPMPAIDIEAIRQEGYNQGICDAKAQQQAQIQQAVSAFAEACQKIDTHRQEMMHRSHGDTINLIISLIQKILGKELSMSRSVIATTLQNALNQAIESEEYYVTLHPDDLAFAEEKAPELIASVRGLERLFFKTDDNLTRGGCVLESTSCSVDASIDAQLQNIKEFLEEQRAAIPGTDSDEAPIS